MNPLFSRHDNEDVRRLIAQYPLAWVMAPGAPLSTATMLPMLGRYDSTGRLAALLGHMSKRRPLREILQEQPRAQFLFSGPQGYIASEDSGRRTWGPTWNYAAVRVEAEILFDDALTATAVAELALASETARGGEWKPTELGPRYDGMLARIIGFTARVTAVDATFKLAQDEDDEVLARLAQNHPDAKMREWIHALNRDRLG